jgi:hypothetical protein
VTDETLTPALWCSEDVELLPVNTARRDRQPVGQSLRAVVIVAVHTGTEIAPSVNGQPAGCSSAAPKAGHVAPYEIRQTDALLDRSLSSRHCSKLIWKGTPSAPAPSALPTFRTRDNQ